MEGRGKREDGVITSSPLSTLGNGYVSFEAHGFRRGEWSRDWGAAGILVMRVWRWGERGFGWDWGAGMVGMGGFGWGGVEGWMDGWMYGVCMERGEGREGVEQSRVEVVRR